MEERENEATNLIVIETLHALNEHLDRLRKSIETILDPSKPYLPTNTSLYSKLVRLLEGEYPIDVNYGRPWEIADEQAPGIPKEDLERIVKVSIREFDHFYVLVDNLLGYYQTTQQDDGARVVRKQGDLVVLLSGVLELFASWANNDDVEFQQTIPYEAKLRFDEVKVRRAMINIIANALKYSSPKPAGSPDRRFIAITLRRHSTEGHWLLQVESVGKAFVAPEEEARVLEYGVRGASASQIQERGTGIGLAEAKKIAGAHGGTVRIFSSKIEGGAFPQSSFPSTLI